MTILSFIFSFIFLIEITFEAADFKEAVENYIVSKGKYKKENMQISFLNLSDKVIVKYPDARLVVSDVSRDLLSGNVTIPVGIVSENKVMKRVYVSVKIQMFDSVYVTKRSISQHQNFTNDNIEKKWMEITGIEEQVIKNANEVLDKRTSRYISDGKLITLNNIENLPIIKSGQPITIVSRTNSVVISVYGVAKEDGKKGQMITVENSTSGAKLRGKVIDKDKVEIIR
jgi:flagella basal body P-ring formation protein FlgA